MHGIEIEISAGGAERDGRSHKQVLERRIGDRPAYTLVFDGLRRGQLHALESTTCLRTRDVPVSAAEITELDWRARPPGARSVARAGARGPWRQCGCAWT